MGAVFSSSATASGSRLAVPAHGVTWRHAAVAAACGIVLVAGWSAAEVHPGILVSRATWAALAKLLVGLVPPDVSPSFLRTVLRAVAQTMATATAATALSIVVGLPLGALASGMLWRRGILFEATRGSHGSALMAGISRAVRAVLGFVRAVPDILWAILFVTMVGLGPLAGTLALAVAYSGVIGRVYADVFDTVDPQSLEALQSTGATRIQVFLLGMWPQARPSLTAYSLYSLECCVRAASVLGLVGAGGIGYEIGLSVRLFEYHQVLTLMLAFVALLVLTDATSCAARRWLRRTAGVAGDLPHGAPDAGTASGGGRITGGAGAWPRWSVTVGLLIVGWASFRLSGFTPAALSGADMLGHAARFLAMMMPPDLAPRFVRSLGTPLLQTLGIAVWGTLIGVAIGSLIAVPATADLVFLPADTPGRRGRGEGELRWLAFWTARLALNILRAIPELVWVLVCIVAIGVGPFAATIAIGLHTAGVLGKLYAETLEEVPRRPIEALYALGAGPMQVLLRGLWPQARAMLRNYTFLRWEANLRVSTILGLVGGGGLGQAIYNNIQLGFYPRVGTLIVIIYALVMASDWLGDRLGGRVIGV
jgi:phosphonate transport system permease protein